MELTLSLSSSSSSSVIPRLSISSSSSTLSFLSTNSHTTSHLVKRARIGTCRRRRKSFTCKAFFGLGVPELAVIAGVAALVFGPKKLPEVGRSIGKSVKSFQQAAKEFESELKKEPNSIEETPAQNPTTAAGDREEQDIKVISTKELILVSRRDAK